MACTIEIPHDLPLGEAAYYAVQTALARRWPEVAFKAGDIDFKLLPDDLALVSNLSLVGQDKIFLSLFTLGTLSERLQLFLPGATLADEKRPFASDRLTAFMARPSGTIRLETARPALETIQKEYFDHTFQALQSAVSDRDTELFDSCMELIANGIVYHPANARAYLTPERKNVLIGALKAAGCLTPEGRRIVMNAGNGPAPREAPGLDTRIARAKAEGRMHNEAPPPRLQ